LAQITKTREISETVRGYELGSGLFSAFAVHALTFSLPIVMTPVLSPYNPNVRKRKLVLGATYIFCWMVISVPSLFAYLMKGDDAQSDILRSFAKNDILIIMIQVAILVKVTCSYPLVTASLVGSLGELCFGQNLADHLTFQQRAILLPVVNIGCVVIAMFLKDIQSVLGVGGALGGCLVVFAFPSLCRLRISTDPITRGKNLGHLALMIFGVASAMVCCYFSVMDAIKSFQN
jgi:amino acid permease